jgi:hypothetical protein
VHPVAPALGQALEARTHRNRYREHLILDRRNPRLLTPPTQALALLRRRPRGPLFHPTRLAWFDRWAALQPLQPRDLLTQRGILRRQTTNPNDSLLQKLPKSLNIKRINIGRRLDHSPRESRFAPSWESQIAKLPALLPLLPGDI